MSRTIPVQLLGHLQQPATTYCLALAITTPAGVRYGFADLDVGFGYDDGDGLLEYSQRTGMMATEVATNNQLSVDNADVVTLIPEHTIPIPPDLLAAGHLDYSTFRLILVNYRDLSQGHALLLSGTLGQVRMRDELTALFELRGLSSYYRERGLCSLTSVTCRYDFGSPQVNAKGRVGCGFEAESLWVATEIAAVSGEPDRVVTLDAGYSPTVQAPVPGLMRVLTGANAGRTLEISAYAAGVVTLTFPAPFNFVEGDEVEVREDCDKTKATCRDVWDNLINFGGEPHINAGDASQAQMPGARLGPGGTGINDDVVVP